MLTYRRSDHLDVIGYLHSDFFRMHGLHKLHFWLFVLLTKLVISCKCEAVCHCCINYWSWIRSMLWGYDLWFMAAELYFRTWNCRHYRQATEINCDNSAAVFFSKKDKYSKGAKLIEMEYFVVKEEIRKQKCVNQSH